MKARLIVEMTPAALRGPVSSPPSKSLLHRALICSALAGRPCLDKVPATPGDDISATARAVAALSGAVAGGTCGVVAAHRDGAGTVVDCGESGTTLRLLAPVFAALGIDVVLTGRGRLPQRPMQPVLDALRSGGVSASCPGGGEFLPLSLSGRLSAGRFALPGDVSSQFVSGFLLALPLLDGDSRISLSGALQSRSYVDMTLAVMRAYGMVVESDSRGMEYEVPGRQRYRVPSGGFEVEGDASQEAFWHLANHLGSEVRISNPALGGLQGDAAYPALLAEMRGAAPDGPPPEIDVSQIPDLVPALAAAAVFSPSGARIVNGARLRLKESDRIATSVAMLTAIGARARETADGLVVASGLPAATTSGGGAVPEIDGAGDHRIVMAAAMLGTRVPLRIRGAEAVSKSWPSFFGDIRAAGAKAKEIWQ